DLPIDLDLGDDSELDLTGASDDEVLAVFKKMGDEDEVEVIKDEDGIHLTDNETGAEYYIKESEDLNEDGLCEGCGDDVEEEVVYEIELDEDDKYGQGSHEYRRHNVDGVEKRSGEGPKGHYKDYMDEEHLEEDKIQRHQKNGYQRRSGAKVGSDQASPYGGSNESRRSRRPISERRKPKNVRKVTESKIVKEYNELKSKNEQYKGALKIFKNKLNEVALFNTNLAYVNRLFTEHSTTKGEKMNILKRFDGAESIKESKGIYKTIKGELETKTPITESVENKVNRTVKSSKSDLNESTAYVDPQIKAIKDLMKKIS
ncbi:MAG: hypothetical protein ACTSQ3_03375, partial [Candidatus Heimdallarchaeota archaeon]